MGVINMAQAEVLMGSRDKVDPFHRSRPALSHDSHYTMTISMF